MVAENGIIMDLFPPLAWDEEGVKLTLGQFMQYN